MNRRNFLHAILAASMAPAVVKAANLMPVRALDSGLLVLWGDGIHDDTQALQAVLAGKRVLNRSSGIVRMRVNGRVFLGNGTYRITPPLNLRAGNVVTGCHFLT